MAKANLNIERASALSVSVVVNLVRNEINFLKSINDEGVGQFYEPQFVSNALRRYEHFWIPFVERHSISEENDLQFSPPPGNFFCGTIFWSVCCS